MTTPNPFGAQPQQAQPGVNPFASASAQSPGAFGASGFTGAQQNTSDPEFPAIAQLDGRLLLFRPTRIDFNVPGLGNGPARDRITTDVVVLDGDTITHKVNQQDGSSTPLSKPVTAGTFLSGMWISNVLLVRQLKQNVGTGQWILGRLIRVSSGPGKQPAWKIGEFTEQDAQVANAWLNANPQHASITGAR